MNKYNSRKVRLDGILFDSKKESERWAELHMLALAGEIQELERQVRFSLDSHGMHICDYIADFVYKKKDGAYVVEDVKGIDKKTGRVVTATAVYKIKKKLMKACHKIDISEV